MTRSDWLEATPLLIEGLEVNNYICLVCLEALGC